MAKILKVNCLNLARRAHIALSDLPTLRTLYFEKSVGSRVTVRSPRPCAAHPDADFGWIGADSIRLI